MTASSVATASTGILRTFVIFSVLTFISTSKPITIFSSGFNILTFATALAEFDDEPVRLEAMELILSPLFSEAVAPTYDTTAS